jgi:hypothetical protein
MKSRLGRTLLIGGALTALTLLAGCAYDPYYGYSDGPRYSYGTTYSYYGRGYVHAPHYYNGHRHYWRDRDNNPPGPRGGPGTNWENPPGPRGGPGASPDRRWRYR